MTSLKGSFLVATSSLLDPNFHRTVILILEHGDGGAYGVVINRPLDDAELPLPIYVGGPCPSPGLVMLHAHSEWLSPSSSLGAPSPNEREVAPGIFVGDADCLAQAAKPTPGTSYRYRVFRNYSGWGPGQLEQELAAGAWAIVPATPEMLFDVPAEELWARIRPRGLPEPSLN